MPFILGIDEAGYGPTLGPLVVAGTLWQAEPQVIDANFWRVLSDAVCRAGERDHGRLAVDDSKAVFDRKTGISTLERAVLAFARLSEAPCTTLPALLEALGASADEIRACQHNPWYGDLNVLLPLDRVRSQCDGALQRLSDAMAAGGLRCCGLRAHIVTEEHFNRRVAGTRNKASVVVEQVLRLIAHASQCAGDRDLYVRVDRLGGRDDYRGLLVAAFPGRHVHVISVSDTLSRYRLSSEKSDWHIEFAVDGDREHMPVALASMVAKYLREVLMERFNAWWRSLLPTLQPTAGYYNDAKRFLRSIRPALPRAGIPLEGFVRSR